MGGHGADRVEGHDEGEGLAGEVVGAARAGEADTVHADAGVVEHLPHDGHDHLDFVVVGLGPDVAGLGERDDGDVAHQTFPR